MQHAASWLIPNGLQFAGNCLIVMFYVRGTGLSIIDSVLSIMNISEIRKLVEIIRENDLVEFEMDEGDFSIRIRRGHEAGMLTAPVQYAPAPVATPAPPPAAPTAAAAVETGVSLIKSPMVGTFYRSPSPDSQPFITEGSKVVPDSVVCIIEAMKVMNEIQSEISGTVLEVLVGDGEAVEYGQPLFKVKA
jgi:acetyl-CoA carboxylase biotin carboxyl carrier protein